MKSVTKSTLESSMKKRNTEDWKKAKELESTRLLGKIFETHRVKKKFNNTYEMIKINTETYAKKCINSMTVKNKKVVQPKMKGGHQNWHKDKDKLKEKEKENVWNDVVASSVELTLMKMILILLLTRVKYVDTLNNGLRDL